jgi:hypothetical protein
MASIKNLVKICHCQKNQIHLQIFLLLKNTSYNVFKVFFIHWIDFKLLKYIYQYIEIKKL